jgi:Cu/Ag efflux pump CusA
MAYRLIQWALNNPLIVILLAIGLIVVGVHSFRNVNVEAYPDPAPAIIEVIAQYPGASAEEVERQVSIPLEVATSAMPLLKYTRTKSLFGLSHMRLQFEYGLDFYKARQEVINRLQFVDNLPPGVQPTLSPQSPTGEILRYTLGSPKDPMGCKTGCSSGSSAACRGSSTSYRAAARSSATRFARTRKSSCNTASTCSSCRTRSPTTTATGGATTSSKATTCSTSAGSA